MNIRIQTYGTYQFPRREGEANMSLAEGTAIDALKKGLGDLQEVCDVVADEFSAKRQQFNDDNGIDR